MKMNPEIKARWVERLRSGEYVQARMSLRTQDNKFCCLGVLSQMAADEGVISQPELLPTGQYSYHTDNDSRTATLHPRVAEWAGIKSDLGAYGPYNSLAGDNDDGADFATIADTIEEHF